MNKCNKNFKTQYAYVEGKKFYIDEFTKDKKPYCDKGHELVFADCKKINKYFRHKNCSDVSGGEITEWHIDWQSHFPETEVEFKNKNKNQIKNRRTDILLNDNFVIEIQHSKISSQEVSERKHDYEVNNKKIIWIIDGTDSIKVNELTYSNRVYLEFIKDNWKYENFNGVVYYDIQERIYQVDTNLVKTGMIDVQQPIDKIKFINEIKNNNFELWNKDEIQQCNLFVKQLGAGNGKTYNAVRLYNENEFKNYKYFIYLTKQHSAKSVIKQEFDKHNDVDGEIYHTDLYENKKHIIKLKNGVKVIIATIDSFIYSIADKNKLTGTVNLFEGYLNCIINEEFNIHKNGKINFGVFNPVLNKELLLVLDETQDLPFEYAKALIKVMRNYYIDLYVIGDQLQSLTFENNSLVYFKYNEFSFINKVVHTPLNICRRFNSIQTKNFVNNTINFEKYDLPSVSLETECDVNSVFLIDGENLYSDDTEDKINIEIEKIMEKYIYEVNTYNRVPEDFMVVTPFTKKNRLVETLQTAINIFWLDKFKEDKNYIENVLSKHKYWKDNYDTNSYNNYAIFHKSEDGTSIDLDESTYATRMVSIHTSKGDGRKVVFVIGLDEKSLNRFAPTGTLVYESLIHVPFTRVKERMYIRIVNNGDDICNRIYRSSLDICPILKISNHIKYNFTNEIDVDDYLSNIINKFKLTNEILSEKRIIDMGYHSIRYYCIYINIMTNIISSSSQDDDTKKQFEAILHKIKKIKPIYVDTWKEYTKTIDEGNITLLDLSSKGDDYKKYFQVIKSFIEKLQFKLNYILSSKNKIVFCPLESIILTFMIFSYDQGKHNEITINDIYNIIDKYNKNYIHQKSNYHEDCLCFKYFQTNSNINPNMFNNYICEHFNKMKIIDTQFNYINEKYPNLNWLTLHPIKYNGHTEDFILRKNFNLIAYNPDVVLLIYIKPTFSNINLNEVILDTFFDNFLLMNIDKQTENFTRLSGKKIINFVVTTDIELPYILEHNNIDEDTLKNYIKSYIMKKYDNDVNLSYIFYKYWKDYCEKNQKLHLFLKEKQSILIEEFDKCFKVFEPPSFLYRFFIEILSIYNDERTKSKEDKIQIINKYNDKDYFINRLKDKLETCIDNYLGLSIVNNNVNDDNEEDW